MIHVIRDRIHTFREIAYKKVFPVEHFGVDLRGESGSPRAPPGPFLFRAPLRGGEAFRAARTPGKLALGPQLVVWPAACTPTGWRWLRRVGRSCVCGAPRSGSRRLEAEWLGRFDR